MTTTTPDGNAFSARPECTRFRACLLSALAAAMAGAFACGDGPQPPAACGDIEPQTTYVGQKRLVEPCFEDPEMGQITLVAAVSSDPGVATSEVAGAAGDKVRIKGVSPGTATITVTAMDPDSLTGELAFEALVPNRPPRRREDGDGNEAEIPEFLLLVAESAAERVLSEYFFDPDGQDLAWGARSSDPAVASVALSADTLAVTGVSAGSATVTVTATDPGGLSDTARVEARALGRPGAPTNLVAALRDSAIHHWVDLTWTAPVDTGVTYRVFERHESYGPDAWRPRWDDTDTTFERIYLGFNDTGYNYYLVLAYNAVSASAPSNVDSVFVDIPGVPEPPRFSAYKYGHRVTVQWWPSPNDTLIVRLDNWQIERSLNGGEWDLYQQPRRHRRSAQYIFGMHTDSMRFRIAARYEYRDGRPWGLGVWSNVVRAAWLGPDRPDSLEAVAEGDSTVVLSWKAPADTGNSAITGYVIETSSEGGRNWRYLVANTGSAATTYRHVNVEGGATHLYVVSAITATGVGPPSKVAAATTGTNPDAFGRLAPVRLRLVRPGSGRGKTP